MPNADKPIKNSNEKHNKKITGYYFFIFKPINLNNRVDTLTTPTIFTHEKMPIIIVKFCFM